MKQTLLAVILVIASQAAFGQITYEPGYFISNDGTRTECQIKNLDWKSNPTNFDYRVNSTDGKGDIETISEFGITGGSVFRRFTVQVDQSTDKLENLTVTRNPDFKQETTFLRLLVNGKAILYMYDNLGLIRFFYSVDGSSVSQLVYKRYNPLSEKGFQTNLVSENEQYKQQIFNQLICPSISKADVEKLKYERAALMKFFDRYNECTGTSVQTNEEGTVKAPIRYSVIAGVGFNNFSYLNSVSGVETEIEPAAALRIGAEIEVVIPFNKGLWSFTFQPVYQKFSSQNAPGTIKVDYSSIDFGGGLRRYLFIKDEKGLFLSAGVVVSLPLSSKGIQYPSAPLVLSYSINFVAGVGYRISKFSGELSYGFRRDIMRDYAYYKSDYNGLNVMLGYRLK